MRAYVREYGREYCMGVNMGVPVASARHYVNMRVHAHACAWLNVCVHLRASACMCVHVRVSACGSYTCAKEPRMRVRVRLHGCVYLLVCDIALLRVSHICAGMHAWYTSLREWD